ncbi:MAG TPA: SUMF1/EgtB/PvdO family nonheme iron enzyme [Polyangiaceae bacterium]|nr:SUMF1/EgtB/PvdO family nonheme iron enzyme [Polyangiaceae bacterium]
MASRDSFEHGFSTWLLAFGLLGSGCEIIAPLAAVNQDAAPPAAGCSSLPASKVLTDSTGAMWVTARVQIANSPECVYIDKTEVPVAAYAAWASANPGFAKWHTWCASWKAPGPSNPSSDPTDTCATKIPASQVDPFASLKPIRCVDWCDAEAFCRTARGGRLCYVTVAGGSAQPENKNEEWSSACSNSDTTVWPWGNSAEGGVCNVGQPPQGCGTTGFSCGPVQVQTFSACVDNAGVFDLIGNVAEWLGVCNAQSISNASSPCNTAGGSYATDLVACHDGPTGQSVAKSSRLPDLGFRCCYDLLPVESQDAGLL